METTTGVIRKQWPDLDLKLTLITLFLIRNEKMNSGYGISVLNKEKMLPTIT
jgi:hypothetical protein